MTFFVVVGQVISGAPKKSADEAWDSFDRAALRSGVGYEPWHLGTARAAASARCLRGSRAACRAADISDYGRAEYHQEDQR